MYTTSTEKKSDRKMAELQLRTRNEDTFRRLGLMNPYFTIKYPFSPFEKEGDDLFVGMFMSELQKGDDIYMEFTDKNNNPIYKQPVLYRYKHNPFFRDEYELVPPNIGKGHTSERYLIPVAELELISGVPTPGVLQGSQPSYKPKMAVVQQEDSYSSKEKEDCHKNDLTARDWACIHLKVPMSNKRWLNEIINNAK